MEPVRVHVDVIFEDEKKELVTGHIVADALAAGDYKIVTAKTFTDTPVDINSAVNAKALAKAIKDELVVESGKIEQRKLAKAQAEAEEALAKEQTDNKFIEIETRLAALEAKTATK